VTTPAQPAPPAPLERYEPFFGLKEPPFGLAPDTRFLFASASHSAALAQVAYAIERREPLVVVTGEIGTGKTLLCRTMLQRLPLKTFLSVIDDPMLERDDLLKQVLEEFGVISKDRSRLTDATRHELVETLKAFLSSLAKIQAHAVVMIDEAQHLRPDVLEQIRLLSNVDDGRGTLLQVVLVGQKDLEQLLDRPDLRQLQQRVSRRFSLEPLNRDEVEQYIGHRLALARDGKPPAHQTPAVVTSASGHAAAVDSNPGVEFTPDAIEELSQRSGGVPRVINILCDRSLEEAHASRLRIIDKRLIESAAASLGIGVSAAAPVKQEAPPVAAVTPAAAVPPPVVPAAPIVPVNLALATAASAEDESDDEWLRALDSADPDTSRDIFKTAVEAVPVLALQPAPAATSPVIKYVALAAVVVLVAAGVLFMLRPAAAPPAEAPSRAAAPAPATSSAPPAPAPAPANTPAPPAAAAITPPPQRPAASTPATAATGERFDIVVASFRTDVRASTVAAEVEALGLPIHRRVADGWQQVVSGPFASRAAAESAQQRIHQAGLTGTQIVPAVQ
jgi:type II secretory pathway predicted ATPase ExeA